MQLFVVLLVIVSAFLLLIKMLGSFSGRLSERMITGHFQSAEALLDRERLVHLPPGSEAARPYLMKKIHVLHRFFEKCPFVESVEARDLLLSGIDAVIDRWAKSDLPEILRYYGVSVDIHT